MANELQATHATGTGTLEAQYLAAAHHNLLFDSQAIGDIPYATSTTTISRLAIGSNDQIMTVSTGVPKWSSTATLASITDTALTSGRIPIASTSGLLTDSADLTFTASTGTLTATSFSGSGASLTGVSVHPDSIKYIAANNSSSTDKAAADIVCDGTNDEADFNTAFATCRHLIAYPGDYYIDNFTHDANDTRSATTYYYGIGLPGYAGSPPYFEYILEGSQVGPNLGTMTSIGGATRFHVTQTALDALDAISVDNVACGIYARPPFGSKVIVRNFALYFVNNQRDHCHGVDLFSADQAIAENLFIQASESAFGTTFPVAVSGTVDADNIGFVDLSSYRQSSRVINVRTSGWSIGINFNADHLVAESCLTWVNTRDFRFGGYNVHDTLFPMTLINCWSGVSKYGPLFTEDVQNDDCSIQWLGAHFENYKAGLYYENFAFVEGASEATAGATRGIINYNLYTDVQTDMWKAGYGDGFQNYNLNNNAYNARINYTLDSDHTWSGVTTVLTAGAALAFGNACYVGTADSKMELAKADSSATMPALAFCTRTIAENSTGIFLLQGFVRDDSWTFSKGLPIYIATTAGLITSTMPTSSGSQDQIVGMAMSSTTIYWNPNLMVIEHV